MTDLIKRDDALAAMNSHDWQKTYFAICALPAIDPAAIREAALQARIEELENSLAWYQMMDAMSSDHVVELTDKLEAAEAKLTKAVEALRLYAHDYVYSGSKARAVLAELEAKE